MHKHALTDVWDPELGATCCHTLFTDADGRNAYALIAVLRKVHELTTDTTGEKYENIEEIYLLWLFNVTSTHAFSAVMLEPIE
jgi:hypothetical protein